MKPIILLTGPSGSGKTTVANELYRKYGLTQIYSYTTRPQRNEEDKEHIFVSQEEFDKIRSQLVSYTKYNGYEYGVTKEQVEDNDIFVVDIAGINYMLNHYFGNSLPIIVYLRVPKNIREDRLIKRDGEKKAKERLNHDGYINYAEVSEQLTDYTIDNFDLDQATKDLYILYDSIKNRKPVGVSNHVKRE